MHRDDQARKSALASDSSYVCGIITLETAEEA